MIMFTFISCSLNIIPSGCNGAFYEVNFKRSAWPDYPSMTRSSRHRLMSCVLILTIMDYYCPAYHDVLTNPNPITRISPPSPQGRVTWSASGG